MLSVCVLILFFASYAAAAGTLTPPNNGGVPPAGALRACKPGNPGWCINDLTHSCSPQYALKVGLCTGPVNERCCQGSISSKTDTVSPLAGNTNPAAGVDAQPAAVQPSTSQAGQQPVNNPVVASGAGASEFAQSVLQINPQGCSVSSKPPGCAKGMDASAQREIEVLTRVLQGNVPSYFSSTAMQPVVMKGVLFSLTFRVMTDFVALGNDADYLRFPLSPYAGVLLANKLRCALPTRALVEAIVVHAKASGVFVEATPLPPNELMQGSGYYWNNNQKIQQKISASGRAAAGKVVGGHKKNPIISGYCASHPRKLDFFGWYMNGRPIQTNPAHEASYADYSHGIRLVSRDVFVEEGGITSTRDYFDLLQDPKYAAVINKGDKYAPQGTFDASKCYQGYADPWLDQLNSALANVGVMAAPASGSSAQATGTTEQVQADVGLSEGITMGNSNLVIGSSAAGAASQGLSPSAIPLPEPQSSAACKPNMVLVQDGALRFCIDIYEFPNQKGVHPVACVTKPEGQSMCGEVGKRLCSRQEWTAACQGAQKNAFPYGNTHTASNCVEDKIWKAPNWGKLNSKQSRSYSPDAGSKFQSSVATAAEGECKRLYQAEPSGSRPACRTPSGIYDLTGNVFELVENTASKNTNLLGGYWIGRCTNDNPNGRPGCLNCANGAHPSGFRSYEWGLRCCADPV